jgi:lipoprotein-anchoring transpeptidase ErfK/SrfK
MQFEADHNLGVDGAVGPQVWDTLTAAVAARDRNPNPYDYLMVSETVPEQLVVWRGGRGIIYQTPVNTGVPGAATAIGTWPVYERFQTTTMVGTDVDGEKYDVPDVPWVAYFNGGDAVHGYWRYSYGYPQSNGCVELPIDNAEVVWSMDPLGTLVTVTG